MSSRRQVAPYCPAEKSSCYAVVDIGGGTGDISVHRVLTSTPDQRIEVMLHSRVNRECEKFLGKLVSDEKFSKYVQMKIQVTCAKNYAELNELVNEKFEKQKVMFGNKGGVAEINNRSPSGYGCSLRWPLFASLAADLSYPSISSG